MAIGSHTHTVIEPTFIVDYLAKYIHTCIVTQGCNLFVLLIITLNAVSLKAVALHACGCARVFVAQWSILDAYNFPLGGGRSIVTLNHHRHIVNRAECECECYDSNSGVSHR